MYIYKTCTLMFTVAEFFKSIFIYLTALGLNAAHGIFVVSCGIFCCKTVDLSLRFTGSLVLTSGFQAQ